MSFATATLAVLTALLLHDFGIALLGVVLQMNQRRQLSAASKNFNKQMTEQFADDQETALD